MARPESVSEELAQLRNTRQMLFYLAQVIEQRDKDLARALDRVTAGQKALDRKLDQIMLLLARYREGMDHCWLESHGSVVQGNELMRGLREDVHKLPALTATATAGAVDMVLAEHEATAAKPED